MKRSIVPDVISGEQEIRAIARSATVREAAEKMRGQRVAALLVIEDKALIGIVTERDLVFRVMAEHKGPRRNIGRRRDDRKSQDGGAKR